jgi:uncharacterized protein (TIGR03435 family)
MYGQTADPPVTFEVASVKVAGEETPQVAAGGAYRAVMMGCRGGPGSQDPGRLTCTRVTLANFITTAYKLKRYQFTPAAWMEDARFDITAKIPAGATKEQFLLMEQNLLAERFKLKAHFEGKEMPGYEMTVGKGGPKFKESTEESAEKATANARISSTRAVMHFSRMTMEDLASNLANQLQRPVTDATGLKGWYDITLEYAPDSVGGLGGRGMSAGADPGAAPAAEPVPTLMGAVQAQLGLKLEQKKGMVQVLVVDHAEKVPVEN